jgi:hypothetical protein
MRRYERQGECKRCGQCCVQEECEYLILEGNIAACKIYENRYARCRRFPQNPPILIKKCGYYFLDTWENNKPVKFGKDL